MGYILIGHSHASSPGDLDQLDLDIGQFTKLQMALNCGPQGGLHGFRSIALPLHTLVGVSVQQHTSVPNSATVGSSTGSTATAGLVMRDQDCLAVRSIVDPAAAGTGRLLGLVLGIRYQIMSIFIKLGKRKKKS